MFDFLFKSKSKEPARLFYDTDIHCHIMPGVDHGAADIEESIGLLEAQKRWGIKNIILTSHVTEDTFENTPETLAEGFERLKQGLAENGMGDDFNLCYSAEYRLDALFQDQFDRDMIVPFPTGHVLVENSFLQQPLGLDNILFNIQLKGWQPIMAHPERYPYYVTSFKTYRELHERGILFQANLLSLSGYHGKESQQTAEKLAKEGMVDFLGSDLHNVVHVEAIDEYLASKSYQKLLPVLEKTVKNSTMKF